MLSFELTAIDIILVIAVIALIVLYWAKLSKIPEQFFRGSIAKDTSPEKIKSNPQNGYAECPRGFGYIKRIADDGSVSERCLDCYRITECYSEQKEIKPQLNQV